MPLAQSSPGPATTSTRAGERPRQAAVVLAVAVLYFLAARLGLSLAEMAEQVTVVWPPTGPVEPSLLRRTVEELVH